VDDSGNASYCTFVVLEEAGERIVRPVIVWWMVDESGYDLGGPLPENMVVKRSDFWYMSVGNILPSLKSLVTIP